MRRHTIVLLGAFALFGLLTLLMGLEPQPTGYATSSANISAAIPAECTVAVQPGLNLVSFPCISTAVPREQVVNGSGIVAMYQYVPGAADPWRVHNPGLPAYVVSDLQHLSRRNGYILIMESEGTFHASGMRVASTDVPLAAGWTLAGYPSLEPENASSAFAGISVAQVLWYDPAVQDYVVIYGPGGTLQDVVPGNAYWINTAQAGTWRVAS